MSHCPTLAAWPVSHLAFKADCKMRWWLDGLSGSSGKGQKEGQEDQEGTKVTKEPEGII